MNTKIYLSVVAFLFLSLTGWGQTQSRRIYLSGESFENPKQWDFYCSAGAKSGEWLKINVPSQWEQEGFGEYTYGRWYKQKGKRPSDESGHYRTKFTAPTNWKDKVVRIVFEGVMTDTKVMVNDEQAGDIHQGGFYRFSFDITDKIKLGAENQLDVLVEKHSSDRSVNAAERMADWWLFGGIYRPVYLEVLPQEHINQLFLNPKADGSLEGVVELSNVNKKATLEISLKTLAGETLKTVTQEVPKNSTEVTLNTKWENILSWTPESPNLYTITFQLVRNKKVVHQLSERIGFRTIEVRPQDGIYCNGTKIVLKGINRHTFWPESGRSTSRRISLMDAQLIKEMNMNAVRVHYPPDDHFLDMCDSIGLFFIDELAGWQNAYRTEIGHKLAESMVRRDVNHPSVIIWSNGNEGGWNDETDPIFTKFDPQKRTVIHPWADFGDIDAHHYPQYQTGVHRFNNGDEIFMPTEFLHSLYDEGGGAGLDDFWAKWTQSPLFAGGFIWAYNDGAIKRSDTGLLDSEGSLAPDGIVGPYREKEGSFFTIKEVWAPIQFEPLIINTSFKGDLFVTNKFMYTNLKDCKMNYVVSKVSGPWDIVKQQTEIATGTISIPSIEPDETRKVKLDLPNNFFDGDVLSITATDPKGNELYTWTWPIRFPAQYLARQQSASSSSTTSVEMKDEKVVLKSEKTTVTFTTADGLLSKIESDNMEVPFSGGPVPVGMKAEANRFESRQEGDLAVFTVWYKGGIDSIRWELHPEGKLKMNMLALNKATNDGGFDGGYIAGEIHLWGITFNYPEEEVAEMTWFGKGPYRVWKNRQKGTEYNLWQKAYNNTTTGESEEGLVYPEFKGYHANTYWAKLSAKSTPSMTIATESKNLFFRVLTPESPKRKAKRTLPPFPNGDLSFLYEINPIHAFKPVSQMGPQSEPSSIRIKKGDEGISLVVWFDFTNEK